MRRHRWDPVCDPPRGLFAADTTKGQATGEGIASEHLSHVFDRFYRSKESRTMPGASKRLRRDGSPATAVPAVADSARDRHGNVNGEGLALK